MKTIDDFANKQDYDEWIMAEAEALAQKALDMHTHPLMIAHALMYDDGEYDEYDELTKGKIFYQASNHLISDAEKKEAQDIFYKVLYGLITNVR